MKQNCCKTWATAPIAYITKSKQRVKQYVNTVYLNNGEEFEIELFNPTSNKVLAKIELNGNAISGGGIVLRPGERVFLERFLDSARKFKFETYMVNDNAEVKNAIKDNGTLSVKFYDEQKPNFPYHGGTLTVTEPWYYDNSAIPTYGSPTFTCSSGDVTDTSNLFCCSSLTSGSPTMDDVELSFSDKSDGKLETGRVEKGNFSDQSFTHDNTQFNAWYSWNVNWDILPVSQKAVIPTEIKVYCTSCGGRRKKQAHQFCPGCGTKY